MNSNWWLLLLWALGFIQAACGKAECSSVLGDMHRMLTTGLTLAEQMCRARRMELHGANTSGCLRGTHTILQRLLAAGPARL